MRKFDWKCYRSEMEALEAIKNNPASFKSVEMNLELVKQVYNYGHDIANFGKPILATKGIYNCTGILAYDLSKDYAFLAHSYGNEAYGIDNSFSPSQIYDGDFHRVPKGIMRGSSIHAIEMLDTLSKKELYLMKFVIIVGSKPNVPLVRAMINTILYLRSKRISIESIKLMKPFIEGIHTENDVNHGKDVSCYDLYKIYKDKEFVRNEITGEMHSYDKTRGASFAFDVRDGRMFTFNSDTGQYYTYDENSNVKIKI